MSPNSGSEYPSDPSEYVEVAYTSKVRTSTFSVEEDMGDDQQIEDFLGASTISFLTAKSTTTVKSQNNMTSDMVGLI